MPGEVLVVEGVGSQAALEDADEPVREGAQCPVEGRLANILGRHGCWSVGRCDITATIASTLSRRVTTGSVES